MHRASHIWPNGLLKEFEVLFKSIWRPLQELPILPLSQKMFTNVISADFRIIELTLEHMI